MYIKLTDIYILAKITFRVIARLDGLMGSNPKESTPRGPTKPPTSPKHKKPSIAYLQFPHSPTSESINATSVFPKKRDKRNLHNNFVYNCKILYMVFSVSFYE